MKRTICLVFLLFTYELAASGTITLPAITNATRIVVRKNSQNRVIKTITDANQIKRIANFVNTQRKGWGKPWAGVPVAPLNLELYEGKEFLGHFGIGKNFFETQRLGDFWSKKATPEQRKEILKLIDVSEGDG